MNVQLNSISDTRKTLAITLDKSEVEAEHLAVVAEFAKQARIPGFRPGKAPAAVVAKRFAKDIEAEFKQKVVARAYREGMEQQKLTVLSVVNVDPGTIEAGLSAAITVTVDVSPDFTLPEYAGLPTTIAPVEVSDSEVEAVLEGLRAERADFKAVERPAAKGDYVKLAYEGFVDEKPVRELAPEKQIYGQVPQTWEEVEGAQDGVIPGLGRQLGGLRAEDKKDVAITFPTDFTAVPALAGKTATYKVAILEVRERVLPALDETFIKAQHADSLAGLKDSIRSRLTRQKEHQNQVEQRRQVTEALAAKIDFGVPDSLVQSETQGVLRQFIEENMRRGVPQEQFEKDKKELFEGAQKAAAKRVKLQLILARIAEAEKIEVTEKDIDGFIYREAMRTGQRPEKLVKELSKDRDAQRSVRQSILFDKAVDFLVTKASVTTVAPKA